MTKVSTIKDKREAVLDAAMGLIAEQGFHAAPMALIAQRAGVAAGTIYHYFSSKEDMIVALYGRSKARMGAALMAGVDAEKGYKARFFAFWLNLFYFFTENPAEFQFLQQHANSPAIARNTRAENEVFYKPVVDFLVEGSRLGVLREMHPELTVALVYGTVVSAAQLHLEEKLVVEGQHLQDAVQAAWDCVKIT